MQAFVSECDWYDRLSHCMQGSNPFLEKVPGLHGTAIKLQIYSLAFISMQRTPFKADKNRFVGAPSPSHSSLLEISTGRALHKPDSVNV